MWYAHPYAAEIDAFHPTEAQLLPPAKERLFPPMHTTPCTWVATEAALQALAALAAGLRELDVGELAVARFGTAADVIHGFSDGPLAPAAAARAASSFTFAAEATHCGELLCTALAELRAARGAAAGRSAPLQLLLVVSDGRFDASARAALRRLQRDAADEGVAVVLLLLDRPGPALVWTIATRPAPPAVGAPRGALSAAGRHKPAWP